MYVYGTPALLLLLKRMVRDGNGVCVCVCGRESSNLEIFESFNTRIVLENRSLILYVEVACFQ